MDLPSAANSTVVFLLFVVLGLLFQLYTNLAGYRSVMEAMQRPLPGESFRQRAKRQFSEQRHLTERLEEYRTTLSEDQRATLRLLLIGGWAWGALIVLVLLLSEIDLTWLAALVGLMAGTLPVQLAFTTGHRSAAGGPAKDRPASPG